jgi:histone acetyltransferase (RNA polymerase elongator complex component)
MMVSKNSNSLESRDPNSKCYHGKTVDQMQGTRDQEPETGKRPFVIPIFLPHAGCPHQCVFCNQDSITGIKESSITTSKFQSRVEAFLEYNTKQRRPVEIAFFGGNFLGQTTDAVKMLLTEAAKFVNQGRADSIRFSTRPDSIDRQRLEILGDFPVTTIEIGVQSMDPRVLKTSRRGHSDLDTEHAVGLLKDYDYTIGVQIMIGLPEDEPDKMMETGQRVVDLKTDFVRIYPTLVIQGSPLAKWYQKGKYRPLSLNTAVTRVKHLYLLFQEARIPVIRMGLQHAEEFDNPETILAGPYHPAFGHLVYSEIFLDRVRMVMESDKIQGEAVDIRVHPKNVSQMRGLNNENIRKLNQLFHLKSVGIIPDSSIAKNELMINTRLISVYN